jgi:hypothetical protein
VQLRLGRRRYGAAISPDRITLVELKRTVGGSSPLPARTIAMDPPLPDGEWPGIQSAFEALREMIPPSGELAVALLRPLSAVKRVVIPVRRRSEIKRMLEHNIRRFMALPPTPVEVAFHSAGASAGASRPLLLAAAPSRVVSQIRSAAWSAGIVIQSITSGPVAIASGAAALLPSLRRGNCAVAMVGEDSVEVLFLSGGTLWAVRSSPSPRSNTDSTVDVGCDPIGDRDGSSGEGAAVQTIRRFMMEAAERFHRPTNQVAYMAPSGTWVGKWNEQGITPEDRASIPLPSAAALAAFGAERSAGRSTQFLTESDVRSARRDEIRRVSAMFAVSAALLVGAGGLHLGDLRAELAAVGAEREKLRPSIEAVMRARSTVSAMNARTDAIDTAARYRVGWPDLLAAVAQVLPIEAHLLGLEADTGWVRLEIRALSASGVMAAFENAPRFSGVRLAAPVRREETPLGDFERLVLLIDAGSRRRLPADGNSAPVSTERMRNGAGSPATEPETQPTAHERFRSVRSISTELP